MIRLAFPPPRRLHGSRGRATVFATTGANKGGARRGDETPRTQATVRKLCTAPLGIAQWRSRSLHRARERAVSSAAGRPLTPPALR
jgi:hypothetical protein